MPASALVSVGFPQVRACGAPGDSVRPLHVAWSGLADCQNGLTIKPEPRAGWEAEIRLYHGQVGPGNVLGWRIGQAARREFISRWREGGLTGRELLVS